MHLVWCLADRHFRQLAFVGDAVLGTAAAMEGRRLFPEGSPKGEASHDMSKLYLPLCCFETRLPLC